MSPHANLKGAARSVKVEWAPLIGIGAGSLLLIIIVLLGLGGSTGSRLEELTGELEQKSAGYGVQP